MTDALAHQASPLVELARDPLRRVPPVPHPSPWALYHLCESGRGQ